MAPLSHRSHRYKSMRYGVIISVNRGIFTADVRHLALPTPVPVSLCGGNFAHSKWAIAAGCPQTRGNFPRGQRN